MVQRLGRPLLVISLVKPNLSVKHAFIKPAQSAAASLTNNNNHHHSCTRASCNITTTTPSTERRETIQQRLSSTTTPSTKSRATQPTQQQGPVDRPPRYNNSDLILHEPRRSPVDLGLVRSGPVRGGLFRLLRFMRLCRRSSGSSGSSGTAGS